MAAELYNVLVLEGMQLYELEDGDYFLGFDSELAQAGDDPYDYVLDTLFSTTNYGPYDGSVGGDGAFSFSSTDSLTVLDFLDLVIDRPKLEGWVPG